VYVGREWVVRRRERERMIGEWVQIKTVLGGEGEDLEILSRSQIMWSMTKCARSKRRRGVSHL
jgi:hypothetical protein